MKEPRSGCRRGRPAKAKMTAPDWFPQLVTERQLAEITGIPITTLQTWRKRGQAFPSIKLEKRVLYDLHDVKKYLEQQKVLAKNLDGNPYAA